MEMLFKIFSLLETGTYKLIDHRDHIYHGENTHCVPR